MGSAASARSGVWRRSARAACSPWGLVAFTLGVAPGGVAGCREGCARDWIAERSGGIVGPVPASSGSHRFGVDCPSGLARCRGGGIEVSLLHAYRVPCSASPEECRCPWTHKTDCPNGCIAEGFEWPLDDTEVGQLCAAPVGGAAIARPVPVDTRRSGDTCGDDRYACAGATVFGCDGLGAGERARPLAACSAGCFRDGATLDDPELTAAAAVALLCKH